jgi:hypothetical protein
MTLNEIFEMWEKDSTINPSELGNAALDLAKLHHKYYSIYAKQRLLLRKLESEMKELKLSKQEFYVDGPTEEQLELGWKLPAKGRILKSDVSAYMDADSDIIQHNLKIAYQQEKIDALDSIIRMIRDRGFHIKSAIDFERFKVGG